MFIILYITLRKINAKSDFGILINSFIRTVILLFSIVRESSIIISEGGEVCVEAN